jgi:hypothetical protein
MSSALSKPTKHSKQTPPVTPAGMSIDYYASLAPEIFGEGHQLRVNFDEPTRTGLIDLRTLSPWPDWMTTLVVRFGLETQQDIALVRSETGVWSALLLTPEQMINLFASSSKLNP